MKNDTFEGKKMQAYTMNESDQSTAVPCEDAIEYEERRQNKEPQAKPHRKRHHYRFWFGLLMLAYGFTFYCLYSQLNHTLDWLDSSDGGYPILECANNVFSLIFLWIGILVFLVIITMVLLGFAMRNKGATGTITSENLGKSEVMICCSCGWKHSASETFCPACGSLQ